MVDILNKLFSCVHRNDISKNIKPVIYSKERELFKLSRFELMCDEILICIFEYISIIDLYNGFINLNFRLNILLRDINIGIYLNQNLNSNILNKINYFSKQINFLHIDYYPLLNLNKFVNIRSLIIYLPTKIQLLSINNEIMPNLSRLFIGIINQNDEEILYKHLFGKKQFVKLNYCYLFQINLNQNQYLYQICLNLRKLFVTNIKRKDFIHILSLLPNLYQLEICISDGFSTKFENLTKFYHQNLRILKIEFLEKISQLNNFNSLICFIPYIEQCTLFLVNLIYIKDYIYLQNIIIQNLLKLKQFICSIDYYCQLSSNQMINKFNELKIKNFFFQNIKILPCLIHQDQCLRKTYINQIF